MSQLWQCASPHRFTLLPSDGLSCCQAWEPPRILIAHCKFGQVAGSGNEANAFCTDRLHGGRFFGGFGSPGLLPQQRRKAHRCNRVVFFAAQGTGEITGGHPNEMTITIDGGGGGLRGLRNGARVPTVVDDRWPVRLSGSPLPLRAQ